MPKKETGKVTFYELGANENCKAKRWLASFQNENEEHSEVDQDGIDRAYLIRRFSREWAMDLYDIRQRKDIGGDAEKEIEEKLKDRISNAIRKGFESLYYQIPETRNIAVEDAIRIAERYAVCEAERPHMWNKFPAVSRDVILNGKLTAEAVMPDYIDYDTNPVLNEQGEQIAEGTLRVVRISSGKPTITKKAAPTDLQIYALIQYGKTILKEKLKKGYTVLVEGCFYFLRKENDSNGEKPNFDEDFFLEKYGRNIVRNGDVFDADSTERTKLECDFDEIIEKFIEGRDPEQVSECEQCRNYYICHFTKPPVPVAKVEAAKKIDFRKLSKEQKKAVTFQKGIMLINAGAGSGKTVILSSAPVFLLKQGVRPEGIFMSTFSRSGMEEIGPRTEYNLRQNGLGEDFGKIRIQTQHAFGYECIKKIWKKIGFTAMPEVCEDVDKSEIIAELLADHPIPGFEYRYPEMNLKNSKGAIPMLSKIFEIIKAGENGASFTREDADTVWRKIGTDRRNIKGDKTILNQVFDLFDQFRRKLKEKNLVEYSDMEILLVEYLKKDPHFLDQFRFRHILIDEFQDSSAAQVEILKALCKCPTFESLRVVGDDWQSIGAFRGITPKYMIDFEKTMHDEGFEVECINLEKNYRCSPKILKAAMNVISKNKNRLKKNLKAVRRGGEDVVVKGFFTSAEEKEFIINDILRHIEKGTRPGDIKVYGSTKYEPESVLKILNPDVRKVMKNPNPILDNCRVRAAIALVSVIIDPKDEVALTTYINAILGGNIFEVDPKAVVEEKAAVREELEVLSDLKGKEQRDMLLDMIAIVDQDDDEIFQWFYDKLESRKDYSGVINYIYRLKLYGGDVKARRSLYYDAITGNTVHSAKGTEGEVVYLMTTKFDSSGDDRDEDEESYIEEMRRLLFVGMTRARDELIITGQYYNGKDVLEDSSGKKQETLLLNQFLGECFEAVGQEYDPQKIAEEKAARDAAKKKQRNADRKAKIKERVENKKIAL